MIRLNCNALCITPVHIGTGTQFTGFDGLYDAGRWWLIDLDKILERVADANQLASNMGTKDFTWANWLRRNSIAPQDVAAYGVSCPKDPNPVPIREFIKSVYRRPYFPGSTVKGALRTAVVLAALSQEENYLRLEKQLQNIRELFRSGEPPWNKAATLGRVAEGTEGFAVRGRKNDAKYDLLKMVMASDSNSIDTDSLQLIETASVGTERFTKMWAEAVTAGKNLTVSFSIAEVEIAFLKELGLERFFEWLHPDRLLEACFKRSKLLLDSEAEYFSRQPLILGRISQLRELNQKETPLIRLGWGQGFLSTTVTDVVRKSDEKLFDEAIRESVSFVRRWHTVPHRFPKTRRVILDSVGNAADVLGWVQLTVA